MREKLTSSPGVAGAKGLRGNVLGILSSVVVGVSSTAPAYSLASTLGALATLVGVYSPSLLVFAMIPMLLIGLAFGHLNRVDPDCGTSFTWLTKSLGPYVGWMTGWTIIAADVIGMASLADIAGIYTLKLFGMVTDDHLQVMSIGCLWIVIMTLICVRGIELSVRSQWLLVLAEIIILGVFTIAALAEGGTGRLAGSLSPSVEWLNPLRISDANRLAKGLLVAIFIYWGWDSAVSLNEETKDSARTPSISVVISIVLLVCLLSSGAIAAQSLHGDAFLKSHSDDVLSALAGEVLPSPFDKAVILAVLASGIAAIQTTILPTARVVLAMAASGALPSSLGRVQRAYRTPDIATYSFGLLSIACYIAVGALSTHVLSDSVAALGLMIAFYYSLTAYACPIILWRKVISSVSNAVWVGMLPFAGGAILTWAFIRTCADLVNGVSGTNRIANLPALIAAGCFTAGVALMLIWRFLAPVFFKGARAPG